MNIIEPRISKIIEDRNLVVLRDKQTHRALNVSYTEDGLKFTTSLWGNLLYFKKASLKIFYEDNRPVFVGVHGPNLEKSDKVYVEKFVPRNDLPPAHQIAEYTWTDKAYRLILNQTVEVDAIT